MVDLWPLHTLAERMVYKKVLEATGGQKRWWLVAVAL